MANITCLVKPSESLASSLAALPLALPQTEIPSVPQEAPVPGLYPITPTVTEASHASSFSINQNGTDISYKLSLSPITMDTGRNWQIKIEQVFGDGHTETIREGLLNPAAKKYEVHYGDLDGNGLPEIIIALLGAPTGDKTPVVGGWILIDGNRDVITNLPEFDCAN